MHTLIEVGELQEAIDFCKSVLRQPAKTLTGLQTQAYLTVLIACIDESVDHEVQIKKARALWHRIKAKNDNSHGVSREAREISKRNTEMQWKGVMDSMDDTEEYFKQQINVSDNCLVFTNTKETDSLQAAKLPLENKVTVLENELVVSQGRITLLQDQSHIKQEKIDILQAEVALLKNKPSSEYTQSSVIKQAAPPRYNVPWPLSLCLSTGPDPDDFDTTYVNYGHTHRPSMILDNNFRYSTSAQRMTNNQAAPAAEGASDDCAPPPTEAPLSDIEKLMMNGPILVRPGRPLAYVNDIGHIIEVDCSISDLPPMM